MPIYVYRCPKGHETEEMVPISRANDPMPCVKCHEESGEVVEMKKVPSSFTGKVVGGTPTYHPGQAHK